MVLGERKRDLIKNHVAQDDYIVGVAVKAKIAIVVG
jgi:hypothetical protein